MLLSKEQIEELSKETQKKLLLLLYRIEDELCYNCDNVSKTIDYLQRVG